MTDRYGFGFRRSDRPDEQKFFDEADEIRKLRDAGKDVPQWRITQTETAAANCKRLGSISQQLVAACRDIGIGEVVDAFEAE